MHGPYPGELRTRVIDFVDEGGSRREAAEQFDVSVSSAIQWVHSNPCPVEGVLRHWRSTRGRSSPSSARNRTSR
jgi:transposase